MKRIPAAMDSFAFWIIVAYFSLAIGGIVWTVAVVHHTEGRIRSNQIEGCHRGNLLRTEQNVRAAAIRVWATENGYPELAVAYSKIALVDCEAAYK